MAKSGYIRRTLPARHPVVTSRPEVVGAAILHSAEIVSRYWAQVIVDNLTADPAAGGTPRKSGYAAASWIVSIGSPTTLTGGSKNNPDWGPQQASLAAVESWTLSQGAIFITNNAAHIYRLNNGWSKQAPAGFVESAFGRAYNEINQTFSDL